MAGGVGVIMSVGVDAGVGSKELPARAANAQSVVRRACGTGVWAHLQAHSSSICARTGGHASTLIIAPTGTRLASPVHTLFPEGRPGLPGSPPLKWQ